MIAEVALILLVADSLWIAYEMKNAPHIEEDEVPIKSNEGMFIP